jgi:uncharacterized membrane protein YkvA (DUF1232 family)
MVRALTLWKAFQALFDPKTPRIAKILAIAALIYGISPLDLVPDLIPLLGQLDDLGIIALLLFQAFKYIQQHITDTHEAQATKHRDVIDIDS